MLAHGGKTPVKAIPGVDLYILHPSLKICSRPSLLATNVRAVHSDWNCVVGLRLRWHHTGGLHQRWQPHAMDEENLDILLNWSLTKKNKVKFLLLDLASLLVGPSRCPSYIYDCIEKSISIQSQKYADVQNFLLSQWFVLLHNCFFGRFLTNIIIKIPGV